MAVRENIVLFIALSIVSSNWAHRMCADFTSPRPPDGDFKMCNGGWGCCTKKIENELYEKYLSIQHNLDEIDGSPCLDVVKNLLCETCSPFSAHQYRVEETGEVTELPGLCKRYCLDIFGRCRHAIALLVQGSVLSELLNHTDGEAFCDKVKLEDEDYCYPDLIANEYLQNNLGLMKLPQHEPCTHLCVEEVANKLQNPVSITNAGDNTHRLFVVEQRGVIWTFLHNMSRLASPFLNVTEKVALSQSSFEERGLLNVQFHPNYSSNGLFYVSYTPVKEDNQNYLRISEMKVMLDDMNRADHDSERILLEVWQPFINHNGGQILFGSDGYFYIFTGDGGGGGDVYGYSLNKSSLLGKALRIDVNTEKNEIPPYRIPPDNPFVDDPDAAPEIFAYGLRNPWRCSVDPRGRIICGDVGQETYEEIDIIKKGANYGWNIFEGFECYDRTKCKEKTFQDSCTAPIFSYNYTLGKSITGGFVYNGCDNPLMKGKYIFGDFMSGMMMMLKENKEGSWTSENICMSKDTCTKSRKEYRYPRQINTYGEDERGEIYFASSKYPRADFRGGRIYKLSQADQTKETQECERFDPKPVIFHPTVSIVPHLPLKEEIELRLFNAADRRFPTVGRVEIRRPDEDWGTICGRNWTLRAGHVICRMLGFFKAKHISAGKYGYGTGKVRLGGLTCNGDEDYLEECDLGTWRADDCSHHLDAGVWCESDIFI